MNDPKKYEVEGTVTMSAAEFRNMVIDAVATEADRDDYRTKYYDEFGKRRSLEDALKSAEAKNTELITFIMANEEIANAFNAYCSRIEDGDEDA